MSTAFSSDNFNQVFSYPFEDGKWIQKLLIGAVVLLASFIIPVIPTIFLYGYVIEIIRRMTTEKVPAFLPEWNDFGRFFVNGIRALGISVIYMLPIIILILIGLGLNFGLPFVSLLFESNSDAFAIVITVVSVITTIGWVMVSLVSLFLSLVIGIFLPVAITHSIAEDKFAAAFHFRAWWPIFKANISGFLLTYLISIGLSIVSSLVLQILNITIIFCLIAPLVQIFISLYIMLVISPMLANAYNEGQEKTSAIV